MVVQNRHPKGHFSTGHSISPLLHIYAHAIASFEHCMRDSSVVSFIVYFLLNGDTCKV